MSMKPAAETRKPYGGASRSLVIALDVGTTFSGVSYAVLEPGEVPKIHGVTRFPGQEHVAGDSKIPSLLYYDQAGKLKAAGAEAESPSIASLAEEERWIRAELFKLRLRPKAMKMEMNGLRLSPLPRTKTAVDVFGDFLGYLFRCTRNFIVDTHANGQALWSAVERDIQFVLSHPNGWEGAQQAKMRRSAVLSGLIPDTHEGKSRIWFVTEGEASLHACLLNGLAVDGVSNLSKEGFLVVDAGGGTIDISAYAIHGTSPLIIDEIAPPDCVFAGSVFVSRRAREFLEDKLKHSKYGSVDNLDHITKRFDETTKRLFRDLKDTQFIPFGSPLDKDMAVGIRNGQLRLTGPEVAKFFQPSIDAAVGSIESQIRASGGAIKSVWLVGGFAASPWLFNQMQERLASLNITVNRPDSQTSKAVADGAVGFFCDHHVSARISKYYYGVEYLREYDPKNPSHVARKHRICDLPSGPRLLQDAFDCILARGVKVKESTVFSRKYSTELTNLSALSTFEIEVWCYRGKGSVPEWILRKSEDFSTLCMVKADLSPLRGSAEAKQSASGTTFWRIIFSIEIHFGLTEFRARVKWVDGKEPKYGPASIVYSESGLRPEDVSLDNFAEDDGVSLSGKDYSRTPSRPRSYASPHAAINPLVEGSPKPGPSSSKGLVRVSSQNSPRPASLRAPKSTTPPTIATGTAESEPSHAKVPEQKPLPSEPSGDVELPSASLPLLSEKATPATAPQAPSAGPSWRSTMRTPANKSRNAKKNFPDFAELSASKPQTHSPAITPDPAVKASVDSSLAPQFKESPDREITHIPIQTKSAPRVALGRTSSLSGQGVPPAPPSRPELAEDALAATVVAPTHDLQDESRALPETSARSPDVVASATAALAPPPSAPQLSPEGSHFSAPPHTKEEEASHTATVVEPAEVAPLPGEAESLTVQPSLPTLGVSFTPLPLSSLPEPKKPESPVPHSPVLENPGNNVIAESAADLPVLPAGQAESENWFSDLGSFITAKPPKTVTFSVDAPSAADAPAPAKKGFGSRGGFGGFGSFGDFGGFGAGQRSFESTWDNGTQNSFSFGMSPSTPSREEHAQKKTEGVSNNATPPLKDEIRSAPFTQEVDSLLHPQPPDLSVDNSATDPIASLASEGTPGERMTPESLSKALFMDIPMTSGRDTHSGDPIAGLASEGTPGERVTPESLSNTLFMEIPITSDRDTHSGEPDVVVEESHAHQVDEGVEPSAFQDEAGAPFVVTAFDTPSAALSDPLGTTPATDLTVPADQGHEGIQSLDLEDEGAINLKSPTDDLLLDQDGPESPQGDDPAPKGQVGGGGGGGKKKKKKKR